MKECPVCGGNQFQIEEINGASIRKCSTCGAYLEDAGEAFEINSFVPVYERDLNGRYPGCPKCGCTDVHKLTEEDWIIRGNLITALLFDEPYLGHRRRFWGEYECRNPKCRHLWR